MDARVLDIMKKLDCTEEEALEILVDDEAIDHGEKLFELTDAQKKVSKEARSVDRKPAKPGEKNKRTRKEDSVKREILDCVRQALFDGGYVAQVDGEVLMEVTNIERQLDFTCGDRRFRIVLSAPRK